jgi:hypothetical protein
MTVAPISLIRGEVIAYLTACEHLLADNPGSLDEFMIASQGVQQKKIRYTDEELRLVQRMLLRISLKRGT